MAKKSAPGLGPSETPAPEAAPEQAIHQWTREELLRVKHLGPSIIGPAMYAAKEALVTETSSGIFGPALLGVIPDAYKDQRPVASEQA